MSLLQSHEYRRPQEKLQGASACERCGRIRALCVCAREVCHQTTRRVLILQHPREQDIVLGSAPLLQRCVHPTALTVGLSWPSLTAALGEPAVASQWAVLWPDRKVQAQVLTGGPHLSLRGHVCAPEKIAGLIVLDGTWSQGKTLWWRNPWLLKCPRLTLAPAEPSIYGKLRREPSPLSVSSLEAVADALTFLGEPLEIRRGLRRVFRTMVQRVRDTGLRQSTLACQTPSEV